MTQKFYLHNATSGVSGTLPTATQSGTTANVTATGFSTPRAMDGTIGTSQTSASLTTLASTSQQFNAYRIFCSSPLAAQTVTASGLWTLQLGLSQSNTSSAYAVGAYLYFWRPSTGAVVVKISTVLGAWTSSPGTTETNESGNPNVSWVQTAACSAGDILVCELWSQQTQSMATAYTNTAFYDGTTEGSATSNAAYINAPVDIPLQGGGSSFTPPPPLIVPQAIRRASLY